MPVAALLQIVCDAGVAATSGNGFTVITTTTGVPLHRPAVGVIVYVAVPCAAPEVVNVCAIVVPEELLAPVTPL